MKDPVAMIQLLRGKYEQMESSLLAYRQTFLDMDPIEVIVVKAEL